METKYYNIAVSLVYCDRSKQYKVSADVFINRKRYGVSFSTKKDEEVACLVETVFNKIQTAITEDMGV